MELFGKVAAMVTAHIEHKPEQLGDQDVLYVVSDVVKNGIITSRHHKDLRAKMAHPFVRVLLGPGNHSSQSVQEFSRDGNISIVGALDVDINAIKTVESAVAEHYFLLIYRLPPQKPKMSSPCWSGSIGTPTPAHCKC
jgi:hypothetical protein